MKTDIRTVRQSVLDDTENRIAILLSFSDTTNKTDPAKALDAARQALQIAREHHRSDRMIDSLEQIGHAWYMLDDFDASIESFERAIEMSNSMFDRKRTSILYQAIARPLNSKGQFSMVIDFLHKALWIQEQENMEVEMIRTLRMIGSTCYKFSDYKEAYDYFQRSLELANRVGT